MIFIKHVMSLTKIVSIPTNVALELVAVVLPIPQIPTSDLGTDTSNPDRGFFMLVLSS